MAIDKTHAGNQVNQPSEHVSRSRSRFDNSYMLCATQRFGDLFPHLAIEAVEADNHVVRSAHNVRSYTLKAPLMQDIEIKKDYFLVPNMALLPFVWDRFKLPPTYGDDVPDDVNTVISRPLYTFNKFFKSSSASTFFASTSKPIVSQTEAFFRWLLMLEMFFSAGSLVNILGRSFIQAWSYNGATYKYDNFDSYFDNIMSVFANDIDHIVVSRYLSDGTTDVQTLNVYFNFVSETGYNDDNSISIKRFLELFRDDPSFTFDSISLKSGVAEATFRGRFSGIVSSAVLPYDPSGEFEPFNFARCASYQLVCSHFYTNDKIDFVYSADLYRQNVQYAVDTCINQFGISLSPKYSWNGLQCPYDYLSGHYLEGILNGATFTSLEDFQVVHQYLSLIFVMRRSLRYQDYFTGGRPRPLAVGDTNVAVVDSHVSIIDTIKNIQVTRFLNAVNRTGRKISEYVKSMTGVDMQPDYHNPLYLGHTADKIGSSEVENTGSDQLTKGQSVTSVLRSNAERYAFDMSADRDSVIIGICYFDIKRNYAFASDRNTMHATRYDIFNNQMQFIGDQPIYRNEITSLPVQDSYRNFAYTLRYMEYKQRISRAVGGFVNYLPGWTFLADNVKDIEMYEHIGPDYIRSSALELDSFYVSLTGIGLASYFHFVVVHYNNIDSNRQMAFAPSIL